MKSMLCMIMRGMARESAFQILDADGKLEDRNGLLLLRYVQPVTELTLAQLRRGFGSGTCKFTSSIPRRPSRPREIIRSYPRDQLEKAGCPTTYVCGRKRLRFNQCMR